MWSHPGGQIILLWCKAEIIFMFSHVCSDHFDNTILCLHIGEVVDAPHSPGLLSCYCSRLCLFILLVAVLLTLVITFGLQDDHLLHNGVSTLVWFWRQTQQFPLPSVIVFSVILLWFEYTIVGLHRVSSLSRTAGHWKCLVDIMSVQQLLDLQSSCLS